MRDTSERSHIDLAPTSDTVALALQLPLPLDQHCGVVESWSRRQNYRHHHTLDPPFVPWWKHGVKPDPEPERGHYSLLDLLRYTSSHLAGSLQYLVLRPIVLFTMSLPVF